MAPLQGVTTAQPGTSRLAPPATPSEQTGPEFAQSPESVEMLLPQDEVQWRSCGESYLEGARAEFNQSLEQLRNRLGADQVPDPPELPALGPAFVAGKGCSLPLAVEPGQTRWSSVRILTPGRYRLLTEHCPSQLLALSIYPSSGTRTPRQPEPSSVPTAIASAQGPCPSLEVSIDEAGFYLVSGNSLSTDTSAREAQFYLRATEVDL